ncbi:MAG: hypothetical protein L6Q92_09295 [Phycisphaerae bacterium]|nr:hypothetical protein [Phycisphaerae bacterium]
MTFYAAPSAVKVSLTRHLGAERGGETFVAGRGVVVQWERVRRQNHWLDCLVGCAVAASIQGAVLFETDAKPTPRP